MTYSVGIDIGGTFTDCIVYEHGEGMNIFKSPSTPGEFEEGFIDVLELAAEHYQQRLDELLANVDCIVHGTTVATNALVEGKIAHAGLICNDGHPDILTLREAPRKRAFDWKIDYPEPFVARNRTCEVAGRLDSRGNEITPLSEPDVRRAVVHFKRCGVEAIAVCLLWSIVNGAHERRVRDVIREEWPDVPITLSHELNPIPREYRRAISAAIDASLHPVIGSYVRRLGEVLGESGFKGELLMANCVGGMMPADEIIARPIYSVMSGPTLAPIAALSLTGEPDVIVIDMGGATFDVSAIRGRQLVITAEAMVGKDLLGIPKVDVRSVGAGGGSIAWVDAGGLLRVGPQSAGAKPGPACYRTGGTEPTVTDANVVLGIIDPDYFLGGRIKLDKAAAERAVGTIAERLGIGLMAGAYAIHTTSNHNMNAAIEDITINEGIDPRESYLVAGGGGTACHIGEMARALGLKRYMIPSFSAGLSAYGGLISDIRWEETATLHTDSRRFAFAGINELLARLRARGRSFLDRAKVPADKQRFEYVFEGRYEYQSWEIDVPFSLEVEDLTERALPNLVAAFHEMHERIYTVKEEEDVVEFTTWKVRAIGDTGGSRRRGARRPSRTKPLEPKSRRPVYIKSLGGATEIPVYEGNATARGDRIGGPAIIEEETTTILLLPEQIAEVDDHGNYLVVDRVTQ